MARRKKKPDRISALEAVSKTMEHWQPAHTVLTDVVAQPTIFPQFNVASGVGGWPLQRPCLIHGPSSHGKTVFLHGLGKSFLQAGHFYNLVDAEMTTPDRWVRQLMASWADSPGFNALRPKSYEQAVDAVRSAAEALAEAREKELLPEETTMLFGIDSIRKLNPDRLMKKIASKGADHKDGSIDGAGGRAAQYKAALNAQWLDELVPLLHHANCALAFIGREAENTEGMGGKFDRKWKLTGGKSLFFDSSLVIRVVLGENLMKGSKENARMVGQRHRLEIHKTKITNKENKVVLSHFHTSNGALIPAGFDRGRDVLEMAVEAGTITKKGKKFYRSDTGECLPDTWVGAATELYENESLCNEIEEMSRLEFSPVEESIEDPPEGPDIVVQANG